MKGMSETVSTASNAADAWTNPLRDPRDLRLPRIAGPCSIVIFGVTGDLSRKKLLPAIYDLANRGLLPPSFGLTGFARRDWTEDHFKDFVKENVQAHCRTPFKESTWKQLAAGIRFVHVGAAARVPAGVPSAGRLWSGEKRQGCLASCDHRKAVRS